MDNLSISAAFLAGLISFFSPCVLPLIPSYICYVSGVTIDELEEQTVKRSIIILNTLIFIFGFSIIFVILGLSATLLTSFLIAYARIIQIIMGIIVLIFALYISGLFKSDFLTQSLGFDSGKWKNNYLGSFFLGVSFAFAWTPCVGPILASILMLASKEATLMKGTLLLISYSLGLGLPFLLTGLLTIQTFYRLRQKINPHMGKIKIASGALLFIIGILILTDNFSLLWSLI